MFCDQVLQFFRLENWNIDDIGVLLTAYVKLMTEIGLVPKAVTEKILHVKNYYKMLTNRV